MNKRLIGFVVSGLLLLSLPISAPAVPAAVPVEVPSVDLRLQASLERDLSSLGLQNAIREGRLAVSLLDITDSQRPRYASVNDRHMMYAASLPKIAILLAGFERIQAGLMEYTPAVRAMFVRIARVSSNVDASSAIQRIGFDFIAKVLTSGAYKLYDPLMNGGLWIGKAYGGPNDSWKRDPLHNISHGATSLQVARFFLMLDQGRLVNAAMSAEIKDILSNPGIHHKFVKGLDSIGVHDVYRKSGSWQDAHCDAALIEHNGHKYIAVALMKDANGGDILSKLIVKLDRLVVGSSNTVSD
jgi:beta-lactamase class A